MSSHLGRHLYFLLHHLLLPLLLSDKTAAFSLSSVTNTHTHVSSRPHPFLLSNPTDNDEYENENNNDLMSQLLNEASLRLVEKQTKAATAFESRHATLTAPSSIGGFKPNGPSPFLSPDAVVQHVLLGLVGCYGDIDDECQMPDFDFLHEAWRFAQLDPNFDHIMSQRLSWTDGVSPVSENQFKTELLGSSLLPFRDLTTTTKFKLLGIPLFDDDDNSCLVKIACDKGGNNNVYMFRMTRGSAGLPKYSHSDCWLITEVIAT